MDMNMNLPSFIGNHQNCGAFHVNEETTSQRIARTFRRVNNEEPAYKTPVQYCDVRETKIRKLTGVRQSGGSEERVSMFELQHERESLLLYGIPLEEHRRKRKKNHERPYIPEAPYIPEDPPPVAAPSMTLASSSNASSSASSSSSGSGNKVQ